MVEILLILFVFELILFVASDYYKFNTVFTPVLCLGLPFAIVLFVAVFVCPSLGFLPVSEYAVVIWCLGLFLFWLSGSTLSLATTRGKIAFHFLKFEDDQVVTTLIRYVSLVFIFFLFLSFARSYLLHGTIGGDDFSKDFASHGLAAHCLSLLKFNSAYLVAVSDSKRYQNGCIVLLTFLFLFLYNVKGGIILTALVCLFARLIMSRAKISVSKVVSLILLGTTFFALSYIISLGSISFDFIVFHFIAYVIAGVVGFSEHLRLGLPVDNDVFLIVQPIRNVIAVLTGGEVTSRVSEVWVTTSFVYAKQSNVKTFFGDIYIYAGLFKGLLVTSIFGLSSYFVLILAIIYRNLICLILYLFIIASLMLGWFTFYFNDLFYYEMVFYILFILFLGKCVKIAFGTSCSYQGQVCEYSKFK